jgi:hypothetical protein
VDEAIAELKQKLHDAEMQADLAECAVTEYKIDCDKLKAENHRLKRALYKACANRADCEAGRLFWEEDMKKAEKFDKMVDKCRAMAEKFGG